MNTTPIDMAQPTLVRQIEALERLYLVSAVAGMSLRQSVGATRRPTPPPPELEKTILASGISLRAFRKTLRNEFLPRLREVIFVRAVSILEVLLVETIRTLFLHRWELFARLGVIEFKYGELLAAESLGELHGKVIAKECRALQNQGFDAIRNYYLSRCGIDFAKSGIDMRKIDEIHVRRHLLVHRLGKTDSKYRKDYSASVSTLRVPEPYFMESLKAIRQLAEYVERSSHQLLRAAIKNRLDPQHLNVRIDVGEITPAGARLLADDFELAVGGKALTIRSMLVARAGDRHETMMILSAPRDAVATYMGVLSSAAGRSELVLLQRLVLTPEIRCKLTSEQVDMVAGKLPPSPLPLNIHRQIADDLGFSRKQVRGAVAIILERRALFQPSATV